MIAAGAFAEPLACVTNDFCEMRERSAAATGSLSVEGLHNGRVWVTGSDRADVQVRMRVQLERNVTVDVKKLLSEIHTDVTPGLIKISGPGSGPGWSVAAEVAVPRATNLTVETHNGAITVADLRGSVSTTSNNAKIQVDRIEGDLRAVSDNSEIRASQVSGSVNFETHNGAMLFSEIGGSVRGRTNNGHIELGLVGKGTPGRSVDLETHNAAVTLSVARDFSAQVLFESHHGQLKSDFPVPPRDKKADDDKRGFRIGDGAAQIHVKTNNGSVKLRAY